MKIFDKKGDRKIYDDTLCLFEIIDLRLKKNSDSFIILLNQVILSYSIL